jgi:hypothetical protein
MNTAKPGRRLVGWGLILNLTLGCSSSFLVPATVPSGLTPTSGDNLTAGAIARSTRQAQATLDSQSTATKQAELDAATAQAAENATQTAQAEASAAAAIIVRATSQAIVSAKVAWPSLLRESFKDNRLGWPVGITQDHSLAVNSNIADGSYQWTVVVTNGNSYFNLVPEKGPTLSDFYVGVTVQFGQGNEDGESAYGLAFRHVKDDYGFFGILKSGRFRILEVHDTGIYQLLEEDSSAIDMLPGHTNRISVVAVGSDFVCLINDQVVGHLSADIAPGQIGLGVDALTSASETQVVFSDFEINAP